MSPSPRIAQRRNVFCEHFRPPAGPPSSPSPLDVDGRRAMGFDLVEAALYCIIILVEVAAARRLIAIISAADVTWKYI